MFLLRWGMKKNNDLTLLPLVKSCIVEYCIVVQLPVCSIAEAPVNVDSYMHKVSTSPNLSVWVGS